MNKFLKIALIIVSVLTSIMLGGFAVAIVESGLHTIVQPPVFTEFESMSFAEKATALDNYLNSHWFAFPSVVIGHATAPFISVIALVLFLKLINKLLKAKFKAWHFALPLTFLWIIVNLIMGLVLVPVGPKLASIDAFVSLVLGIAAFLIAGGFRKHEGPASVTSDEDVYRG